MVVRLANTKDKFIVAYDKVEVEMDKKLEALSVGFPKASNRHEL